MRRVSSFMAFAVGLAGCEPDFPSPSIVDKLRILAVRSHPAAVRAGETATLSPLVADPLVTTSSLEFEWAACVSLADGEFEIFLPSDCVVASDLLILGSGTTLEFEVPAKIAELQKIRQLTDESGAFGIPVRLVVRRGEERATAIASVAVALEGEPNQNPTVQALSLNGAKVATDAAIPIAPGGVVVLRVSWTAASSEHYTITAKGDGRPIERTEVLDVSWFSSVGELSQETTSGGSLDVSLILPASSSPEVRSRLWAVLRDGRGGVAWTEHQVEIR